MTRVIIIAFMYLFSVNFLSSSAKEVNTNKNGNTNVVDFNNSTDSVKESPSGANDDLPHLPSDSSTLNNLKQLFFKSKELKEKSTKYTKLIQELEKRVTICKKLAEQAALESDKIDEFIHSQLSKHQEIVMKIRSQTVSKYKMDEGQNTNVDKFLSEVAKQHEDYKKTPEYKEKMNQYIRMMEEAKESAEKKKQEIDDTRQIPAPDPNALF